MHDRNNTSCMKNMPQWSSGNTAPIECTCPPAADTHTLRSHGTTCTKGKCYCGLVKPAADKVEQIRTRHETDMHYGNQLNSHQSLVDRDTLLRIVDTLTAELAILKDDHRRQSTAHILICARKDAELAEARAENEQLRAENEQLSMQLVACMTVSFANTPASAKEARDMHPDYWCQAVEDVATAIDREMKLRADLAAKDAEIERLQKAVRLHIADLRASANVLEVYQPHSFAKTVAEIRLAANELEQALEQPK